MIQPVHDGVEPRHSAAICRAYNVFTAEQFKPYADRIIPAAIIPMYTPEEAIEELEFAATQLGFKVIMVGGMMRRPVPALPSRPEPVRSVPESARVPRRGAQPCRPTR